MSNIFDSNIKSVKEVQEDLPKIISQLNKTSEPTYISKDDKVESVLLGYEAYKTLILKLEVAEEYTFEAEAATRIAIQDADDSPQWYTSKELNIDLENVEWSEDVGWE